MSKIANREGADGIGQETRRAFVTGAAIAAFGRSPPALAEDPVTPAPMQKVRGNWVFASMAAAKAAKLPRDVSSIQTLGYYAAGDGGGALYKRVGSRPRHSLWFESVDGAYWAWADTGGLSILTAGAVADGSVDDATKTISGGTDNTAAIQNAVNAHTYFKLSDYVYFPSGLYRTTKPIQCGYGVSAGGYSPFLTTRLIGAGSAYHLSGSVLLCDFSNAPGICLQGQRTALIRGLGLYGRNFAWIFRNNLGAYSGASINDTLASNWIDPALAANAGSASAPYAAIAIDPYSGSAPAPAYPDLTFPAFLGGGITQYNKAFSSDVDIENFYIGGFDTAVVNHPSGTHGSDGNGDFLTLRHGIIGSSRYGISIGHPQCRNVMRQDVQFLSTFCCETNAVHGLQVGKMAGASINCSAESAIQLFKFNGTAIAGPIEYHNFYGEAMWRIGDVTPGSLNETSIVFDNCQLEFTGQNDDRGVPPTILGSGNRPVNVQFRQGVLSGFSSVAPVMFDNSCVSFDGTLFQAQNFGTRTNPYEQFAQNVLGGGLVTFDGYSRTGRMRMKFYVYNVDTAAKTAIICGPSQRSSRSFPVCTYMSRAAINDQDESASVWIPSTVALLDKRQTTSASVVDKTYTFTLPVAKQANWSLQRLGPLPGDVLIDRDTGTTFFVRSYSAGVVIATLQNNYKTSGGGRYSLIEAVDLTSGYLVVVNSRIYTPMRFLLGDITSGSANVTHLGSADGNNGFMTTDLANSDWYLVDPTYDMPFPQSPSTAISALAAGSFTVGGKAQYTQARKRFKLFIRAAPANT